MKTKRMILSAGLLVCLAADVGLALEKEWDRRFGGSGDDYLVALEQADTGDYYLAGHSRSGAGGDKSDASRGGADYWVVKVATNGAKMADRRYGGSADETLAAMSYLGSSPFDVIVLFGTTLSPISGDVSVDYRGDYDFWQHRLSYWHDPGTFTDGDDRRFGGSRANSAMAMGRIHDGTRSYTVMAGSSDSPISGDKSEASRGGFDYWMVLQDGNRVFRGDKRLGGAGDDRLTSVASLSYTSTNGFLAGYSNSSASGDKSEGPRGSGYDFWVVKVNYDGTKVWDRRFGGSGNDYCRVVQATADGGCILGGTSGSGISDDKSQSSRGGTDFWVVKVDADGTKEWDKRFGGSADDELHDLIKTSDGGYLLAGSSASGISGDKTENLRGVKDYWIVKIDANGNKRWDRRFGGTGADELAAVRQTSDGGFILGGTSLSGLSGDKSQASRGGRDYWIVKVSAEPRPASGTGWMMLLFE